MIPRANIFQSEYSSKTKLSLDRIHIGQKVKIIDFLNSYEEKDDENITTGNRGGYVGKVGVLDTFDGRPGVPEMIVLKDEALLLKYFEIEAV